jgi:sugar lactone lactonase YvrE
MDPQGNLWATDAGGPNAAAIAANPAVRNIGHRVVKFSPTGRVLMTIGTGGVAGDPPNHLISPTGLAVAPNGDIFISEGHSGANRVSKFRADGTFVKSWGTTGSAPGQFQLPHDIATDSQGRVFVADRTNYRIQIFDGDGNYIDSWKQFGRPSGIFIDAADNLYVTDSHSWGDEDRVDGLPLRKGIRVGSARTGEVRAYIPDLEVFTHANSGGEGIAADPQGNIYSAVVRRLGVEKFTPQPQGRGAASN